MFRTTQLCNNLVVKHSNNLGVLQSHDPYLNSFSEKIKLFWGFFQLKVLNLSNRPQIFYQSREKALFIQLTMREIAEEKRE